MKLIVIVLTLLIPAVYANSQHQALTLEDCRQLTIQNNKELKVAKEKVNAAGYEQQAAFTKYFPQVSATGGYMWNQKDINLFDMDAVRASVNSSLGSLSQLPAVGKIVDKIDEVQHLDIKNVWVAGVSLVQPVFMGGKIVNYNQITKYARELAESMNNLQLQDVIYQTDETYWQVISLVNKKKLADAYVDLLHKSDHDITLLIEEGFATEADGLSVKVKLNEAEMAQTKVNNGLALTRMLLAQICGLDIEEPMLLADEELRSLPDAKPTLNADIHEALMTREELKSLNLAKEIYKRKEKIVLADMLPHVALTANYLAHSPNVQHGFKNEFKGMLNVGVMMQVPLTGWWDGTYKRNAARAETRIRTFEWEHAREKVELQVNQSVYKVNEANKKLIMCTRDMENAEENLRCANLGFEEGVIPALNLMQAQTAWVQAHSNLIDAQIDAKLSEVYLNKAMGKLTVDQY